MLIITLLTTAKKWKQTRAPEICKWIDQLWSSHTTELFGDKKKDISPHNKNE